MDYKRRKKKIAIQLLIGPSTKSRDATSPQESFPGMCSWIAGCNGEICGTKLGQKVKSLKESLG